MNFLNVSKRDQRSEMIFGECWCCPIDSWKFAGNDRDGYKKYPRARWVHFIFCRNLCTSSTSHRYATNRLRAGELWALTMRITSTTAALWLERPCLQEQCPQWRHRQTYRWEGYTLVSSLAHVGGSNMKVRSVWHAWYEMSLYFPPTSTRIYQPAVSVL